MTDYLTQKRNSYNPATAEMVDELSLWSARFGMLLLDRLALRPNVRGLDVGCGTGFPLFELAHMHGPSSHFTGIDIWQDALDRAERKRRLYGLTNVVVFKADAAHMPFPDATFDLVVSNLGLNNFADQEAVLIECLRVAKLGGRIVLTTNPKYHMHEFYTIYRETLTALGKTAELMRLDAHERHRMAKENLQLLLQRLGFRITDVLHTDYTWRFLDGSAMLRHAFIRLGFLDGWREVVDDADEQTVFAELETRLNAYARQHNELSLTIPMLYIECTKG